MADHGNDVDTVVASLVRETVDRDFEGRATVPLPGGDVAITVYPEKPDGLTEKQRAALQDALAITPEARARVEELLYDDYQMILDAAGPEDLPAIAAPADVRPYAHPFRLSIDAHGELRHRYFVVQFEVVWEQEHGAEILFGDGTPLELDIIGSSGSPESYEAALGT